MFFGFVGLSIDPSLIPPVLMPAAALAAVGIASKFATGWLAGRGMGVGPRGRARAGATLVARGEFSIAIAGLVTTAGVAARFEALAVTYVFLLAIIGPILARITDVVVEKFLESRTEHSLQPMP
jgi:monovalent cation:H+ antiporter-2, CPA2 family